MPKPNHPEAPPCPYDDDGHRFENPVVVRSEDEIEKADNGAQRTLSRKVFMYVCSRCGAKVVLGEDNE